MYLFFDTETTGLPRDYRAPTSALKNWPRMIQLAWLLADAKGREVGCAVHIIKPDGFTIPPAATRLHGITTARAAQEGIPLLDALTSIADPIKQADLLVAHNMQFDVKILGAEFLRSGHTDPLPAKPRICTMLASTDFCRLPGGRYGYKWPKLQELYVRLFHTPMIGAHDALADVRACARCYFELRNRSLIR